MLKWFLCFIFLGFFSFNVQASTIRINLYQVNDQGEGSSVGFVIMTDTQYGLLIFPNLKSLPPGIHGFQVYENPSCKHSGEEAGGHLDPKHTGNHLGPYSGKGKGHLGDLPALTVDEKGVANLPILAPHLKVKKVAGHALIIRADGDNYSDIPEKSGGGGGKIACGIISK